MIKRSILALAALSTVAVLAACSDATVASRNLSVAADNFEIARRVVFYNGITDGYMLTIEGFCSIKPDVEDGQLEVTCKDQAGFKKHFLGVSDNVTYFVEQLDAAQVSTGHYRVVFKPSVIVPAIEVR